MQKVTEISDTHKNIGRRSVVMNIYAQAGLTVGT